MNTPIVLLIFNRPDLVRGVLSRIRDAGPKRLFIIADGPRPDCEDDVHLCEAARTLVDEGVDWPCEVERNYSVANLGCKRRVASGLDWVFARVDTAIILEDDCFPSPSFFPFCEELLTRFRTDERVMHINGTNMQFGVSRAPGSYYFSKYMHVWGWATWRRAWAHYDSHMLGWQALRESTLLRSLFDSAEEASYWTGHFDQIAEGLIDTWDYQWVYSCWTQRGLAITPDKNLISNVGFRADATHTRSRTVATELQAHPISKPRHPEFVIRDRVADEFTFAQAFGGDERRRQRSMARRLRRRADCIVQSALRLPRHMLQLAARCAGSAKA